MFFFYIISFSQTVGDPRPFTHPYELGIRSTVYSLTISFIVGQYYWLPYWVLPDVSIIQSFGGRDQSNYSDILPLSCLGEEEGWTYQYTICKFVTFLWFSQLQFYLEFLVAFVLSSLENKPAEETGVQSPGMYGTKMGLTAS